MDFTQSLFLIFRERLDEFGRRYLQAELIRAPLSKLRITQRSQPLALNFPLHVAHTIEVHLPPNFALQDEAETIKDEAIKLDYKANFAKNILTLDYRFKTRSEILLFGG